MGTERDELRKNYEDMVSKIQDAEDMFQQLKQSNIMNFMIMPQAQGSEASKKLKLLDQDTLIEDLRLRMVHELQTNLDASILNRKPEDILNDVEQKLQS